MTGLGVDRGPFVAAVAVAIAVVIVFSCGGPGISLCRIEDKWISVLSYPFSHTGLDHLIVNLISLGLVSAIAVELGMSWKRFLAVLLSAGWLSAIPFVLAFPNATFMGLSGGICGVFGVELIGMRKYRLPTLQIFLIFVVSMGLSAGIESAYASQLSTVLQLSVHLFALSIGACMGKATLGWQPVQSRPNLFQGRSNPARLNASHRKVHQELF
ncbi:MAG: rhomboid family intramembrane serine protease [Candidatus Hadarchaeales archaeon]